MSDELEKLENPTLQIKLQELYKNPLNSALRSQATSDDKIAKLRATLMTNSALQAEGSLLSMQAIQELAALEIQRAKSDDADTANSKK